MDQLAQGSAAGGIPEPHRAVLCTTAGEQETAIGTLTEGARKYPARMAHIAFDPLRLAAWVPQPHRAVVAAAGEQQPGVGKLAG